MYYLTSNDKNMALVKDDDVLDKYNEIWNNIKITVNIKFPRMPVYDE